MTYGDQETRVSKELEWLRAKLDNHKNGSHPGMTLNLTTKQAQRLVKHMENQEAKIEDLMFMRGIAIDVLSCLQNHMTPPWWMRKAFGDTLAFEHEKQRGGE